MKKPSKNKTSKVKITLSDNYLDEKLDMPSFISASAKTEQETSNSMGNNSPEDIISQMIESSEITTLSSAKAHWYFGEWQALIELDIEQLSNHPDVAKFAALKAAAYQQLNDIPNCKIYINLAKNLGCDNYLISQLLIAGVHNSLGKVAALKQDDDKMLSHFTAAVDVGGQTQNNKLATQARSIKEMSNLGLLPQVTNLISAEVNKLSSKTIFPNETVKRIKLLNNEVIQLKKNIFQYQRNNNDNKLYEKSPQFCFESLHSYQDVEKIKPKHAPFILIDSKSLPRSGIHYLKNTLQSVLGEYFSFCEWYQEVDCCKKKPCSKFSILSQSRANLVPHIRLLKSHDFELNDPDYPTSRNIRRIILHRDPLYMLTSYFVLEQLSNYKDELENEGISLESLWLAHDTKVVNESYQVMDKYFKKIDVINLENWLNLKTTYISDFMNKWKYSNYESRIILYENIDFYIAEIVNEIKPWSNDAIKQNIINFLSQLGKNFKPRNNPFVCKSKCMTEFLTANSELFELATSNIKL